MSRRISRAYMNSIAKHELITPEKEVELAALIAQGSEQALEELVQANLRLVIHIVLTDYIKFSRFCPNEMISEGNMGLWHAAKKFDPSRGAKFASYAQWWIHQRIKRFMTEAKNIKIPASTVQKIRKIKNAYSKLIVELGREPTDKELSKECGYSERMCRSLKTKHVDTVSLNELVNPSVSETTFESLIVDVERNDIREYYSEDYKKLLFTAFTKLDDRSRYILMRRFGLDGRPELTLEELAQDPYVKRTRERVRQIQNRALSKLKVLIKEADVKNKLYQAS